MCWPDQYDFERKVIRAEVIEYEDFIAYGTENAVKEAGKWPWRKKIQDGDIIYFRFNV